MLLTFGKWGNSLGVRIPAPVAREIGVTENTLADLTVENGRLVITPVKDEVDLDELVSKITDDNRHGETLTGYAVGSEFP
jgi:antitoxin MazE